MKFAKAVFLLAAIYGLLVTFPLYFLEGKLNADYPPAINHPEYYYAFIGVTLVWQILFLVIAADPLRYRSMMVLCFLEKLPLLPTFIILYPHGRFPQLWLPLTVIDLTLGVLFLLAYVTTGRAKTKAATPES